MCFFNAAFACLLSSSPCPMCHVPSAAWRLARSPSELGALGPRGLFFFVLLASCLELGAWSLELGLGCVCGVWLWLAVCGVRSAECVEYGVCVLSVPTTSNVPNNNGIWHHASRITAPAPALAIFSLATGYGHNGFAMNQERGELEARS
jgi:hypothetical protein